MAHSVDLSQLATVTPSTATKGVALPGLGGFGNAWGVADAVVVTLSAQADIEDQLFDPGISAREEIGMRLDTGPSGTQVRRYRWGMPESLNGLVAGEKMGMTVGVWIPVGSAITPANVQLFGGDNVGTTPGDAMTKRGAWQWLSAVRDIDGAATEAFFELRVEDGLNFGTADAHVYFGLPTIIAGGYHPMPVANVAEGVVAQGGEALSFEYLPSIEVDISIYLRYIETGTGSGGGAANERLLSISDAALGVPFFSVAYLGTADRIRAVFSAAGGTALSDVPIVSVLESVIELLITFKKDGRVRASIRVAGGAIQAGIESAKVEPMPKLWSGALMHIGGPVIDGSLELLDVMAVLGTRSMDDMAAAL